MEEIEIWKDIPTFEGYYQASNIGRIRSLVRLGVNNKRPYGGKIMKQRIGHRCYMVGINVKGVLYYKAVHVLVAMAFLGHKPMGCKGLVVDHIDNNPLNNRLENLQVVTQRINSSKDKKNKTSQYTGVILDKNKIKYNGKWTASIYFNNKKYGLGAFESEYEAHLAYQYALKEIENGMAPSQPNVVKKKNIHKYIHHRENGDFWVVVWVNGKRKHIGTFTSVEKAIMCRDEFIKFSGNNI